ncbi:hypothetical protein ElyMa_004184900 [Elysia marginata]|uniref:Uncharacterized protein n=1 Tax=Elysia marginata TaxID=1093978 RepID=A0AAV4GKN2_9GAST|nr:hypothetical protein ElyMa_004184900 [Elysia marginata]
MSFEYHNESELCRDIQDASHNNTREVGIVSPIEMYEAVIIILVTGFFAVILAYLFSYIRKTVYRDEVRLSVRLSLIVRGNGNQED